MNKRVNTVLRSTALSKKMCYAIGLSLLLVLVAIFTMPNAREQMTGALLRRELMHTILPGMPRKEVEDQLRKFGVQFKFYSKTQLTHIVVPMTHQPQNPVIDGALIGGSKELGKSWPRNEFVYVEVYLDSYGKVVEVYSQILRAGP